MRLRETNITLMLRGWEAYLIDEFMEHPLIWGRNRINTVETVVRQELDRIYTKGEGILTRRQRSDMEFFGGAQKIIADARKRGYIPSSGRKGIPIRRENFRRLRLKEFSVTANFGGVPAYIIDTLISRGRYQGDKEKLAKSLISTYYENHLDIVQLFEGINRENAVKMRYLETAG